MKKSWTLQHTGNTETEHLDPEAWKAMRKFAENKKCVIWPAGFKQTATQLTRSVPSQQEIVQKGH